MSVTSQWMKVAPVSAQIARGLQSGEPALNVWRAYWETTVFRVTVALGTSISVTRRTESPWTTYALVPRTATRRGEGPTVTSATTPT